MRRRSRRTSRTSSTSSTQQPSCRRTSCAWCSGPRSTTRAAPARRSRPRCRRGRGSRASVTLRLRTRGRVADDERGRAGDPRALKVRQAGARTRSRIVQRYLLCHRGARAGRPGADDAPAEGKSVCLPHRAGCDRRLRDTSRWKTARPAGKGRLRPAIEAIELLRARRSGSTPPNWASAASARVALKRLAEAGLIGFSRLTVERDPFDAERLRYRRRHARSSPSLANRTTALASLRAWASARSFTYRAAARRDRQRQDRDLPAPRRCRARGAAGACCCWCRRSR